MKDYILLLKVDIDYAIADVRRQVSSIPSVQVEFCKQMIIFNKLHFI